MSPTALGAAVFLQLGEVADVDMEPSRCIIEEQPLGSSYRFEKFFNNWLFCKPAWALGSGGQEQRSRKESLLFCPFPD